MTDAQSHSFDVVVVGCGIAGMSVAWALARRGHSVAVVEREASLTAHSTGRSAAQLLASNLATLSNGASLSPTPPSRVTSLSHPNAERMPVARCQS